MAQERIRGGMWIPKPPPFGTATPAFSSILMDASAEKVAFIFQVPRTGALDKFEFRIGASAQLPTNGLKVSFQTVNTLTGDPSGVVAQYRVVTGLSANSWVVPGLLTDDGTDTGVKRSTARGGWLACVIEFQSFSASDVVNVSTLNLSSTALLAGPTYANHYTSAWAKQTSGMVMALKYDDGTYEYIHGEIFPIKDLHAAGGEGNDTGLAFSLPTDMLLGGVYARIVYNAALNDILSVIVTRESDGEVMDTLSVDSSAIQASTAAQTYFFRFHHDPALTDQAETLLRANEVYILSIVPDVADTIGFYEFEVESAEMMDALEGGASFHKWDIASQSHSLTRRPWMGLLLTGADHEIGGNPSVGWQGVP